MTIYEVLQRDHQRALDLIDRLLEVADGAAAEREQMFSQLKQELDFHKMFEEEVFYPAVAGAGDDEAWNIDDAIEEHDQATALLEDLNEMDKTAPEWRSQLESLRDALRHHVEEEEGGVFDAARRAISDQEAERLAEEYRLARGRLTTQPD